jgi:hypothetical protein
MKQDLVNRILARTNQRSTNLSNNTALVQIFRRMDMRGRGEVTYDELKAGLKEGGLGLPWSEDQIRQLCLVSALASLAARSDNGLGTCHKPHGCGRRE